MRNTMRKIVFETAPEIQFDSVDQDAPVFAERDGVLAGMFVRENDGWILRLGGCIASDGYFPSLRKAMEAGLVCGYEYFVE
jgi:hypothetical protein